MTDCGWTRTRGTVCVDALAGLVSDRSVAGVRYFRDDTVRQEVSHRALHEQEAVVSENRLCTAWLEGATSSRLCICRRHHCCDEERAKVICVARQRRVSVCDGQVEVRAIESLSSGGRGWEGASESLFGAEVVDWGCVRRMMVAFDCSEGKATFFGDGKHIVSHRSQSLNRSWTTNLKMSCRTKTNRNCCWTRRHQWLGAVGP